MMNSLQGISITILYSLFNKNNIPVPKADTENQLVCVGMGMFLRKIRHIKFMFQRFHLIPDT